MKLTKMIALVMVLSTSSVAVSAQGVKVGLVDVQRVLLTVNQAKDVRGKLEKFFKEKQKEIKSEEESFKKLQTTFEKQRLVMNEKARMEKELELRNKYIQVQEKTMAYQREIQDYERQLKKPILDNIKAIAEDISNKEGVDLTIESSQTPVLFLKNPVDLTKKIITAYNKKYPKKK